MVPKQASVLCALGDALSDILVTKTRGLYARGSTLDADALAKLVTAAMEDGLAEVDPIESVTDVSIEGYLEVHYLSQTHEILVPLSLTELDSSDGRVRRVTVDAAGVAETIERFHQIHERLYTFSKPGEEVEIVGLRVDVRGQRPTPELGSREEQERDADAAVVGRRPVYMEEAGDFVDTPVYSGDLMRPGFAFAGPAVIQERDTTVVANVGDRVRILPDLSYEITVALDGATDDQVRSAA